MQKSQITFIGHLYLDVFNLEKSSMILPDLDMSGEFGPDCCKLSLIVCVCLFWGFLMIRFRICIFGKSIPKVICVLFSEWYQEAPHIVSLLGDFYHLVRWYLLDLCTVRLLQLFIPSKYFVGKFYAMVNILFPITSSSTVVHPHNSYLNKYYDSNVWEMVIL